jgi:hypothetical protein
MQFLALFLVLVVANQRGGGDPDADRDGLSDFHERHKYFTDPKKADSDGDGVPDGDWDERREYSYSVQAVMHVMAPFDVASMSDDYQDVRVLEERPDLLEFEVVIYPFNTVASALVSSSDWRKPPPELKPFVSPGLCANWDKELQQRLAAELAERGVELAELDDAETARAVSKWLMERSAFEDSFTTFALEFERGRPRVPEHRRAEIDATLARFGRTLEQQLERELFGKGMFTHKIHGSCTSSAIYLSTGLRAAGLPTRTVLVTPLVDANDEREVAWLDARITHVGLRAKLKKAAESQRNSWTSHTFNEVFVGGRWRRLNYSELGQNVLDDALGLMVHVHTFGDHSEGRLLGWGDRERHPMHATLFGGPNPYSCVSLSDRFGAHAKVPNEPFSALRELTLAELAWYDRQTRKPELTTQLPGGGAGYFFAYFDLDGVDGRIDGGEALEFYLAADKHFTLRADGHDDVPAEGIGKFWGDRGAFILKIEPADFARMAPGVAYALRWGGQDEGLRWIVPERLTLTRPKR